MNNKVLPIRIGLDVGSTTVKIAILDEDDKLIYGDYQRHRADIRHTIIEVVQNAFNNITSNQVKNINTPITLDTPISVKVTGSGGFSVSQWLNIPFIQEVVAATTAVKKLIPKTDVVIELGGEDAKITYFSGGVEQRMNGTCAGGTGAFIDQMAALLETDSNGLNTLAKDYKTIYPIAARCGVFAKTDIQPLINEGARREDIAASIFQAVVTQTISGLACGKPIRGHIAFLGGPLHFMEELRERFIQTLKLTPEEVIVPDNSELFVALGAALSASRSICYNDPESSDKEDKERDSAYSEVESINFPTIKEFIKTLDNLTGDALNEVQRLEPLFKDIAELDAFHSRHDKEKAARGKLSTTTGPVFLGLDSGSTTTKAVLIDKKGRILWTHYSNNQGNPVEVAIKVLKELYSVLPSSCYIARSCATGYGEALFQAAFGVDMGEVETITHYRAASFFVPGVEFLLDIGGQDMKCLRMKDGAITSIQLNEACSSGCGSFLDNFARTMGLGIEEFSKIALLADKPVDLGSRCTVFMNSRVKQAQKEGASVADISAGLSYSVIKNALFKVIKLRRASDIGEKVVVQGGTFFNDAVLRAFEKIAGVEAFRPDVAGLMGAYGAALIAFDAWNDIVSERERRQNEAASLTFSNIKSDKKVEKGSTLNAIKDSIKDKIEAINENIIGKTIGRVFQKEDKTKTEEGSNKEDTATLAQQEREARASLIKSKITTLKELESFSVSLLSKRCGKCQNNCLLTINKFTTEKDNRLFITGNRCERGLEVDTGEDGKVYNASNKINSIDKTDKIDKKENSHLPNLFSWKYKRLFSYIPLKKEEAPLGEVGIPRVLNMYENYPLWHTFFTTLGFRVVLSMRSSKKVYEKGIETLPSESVCYPGKISHGAVMDLLERGVKFIFYPCAPYEKQEDVGAGNHYNCPIVTSYPEVLRNNIDALRQDKSILYMDPFLPIYDKERLSARLFEELHPHFATITESQVKEAVEKAWGEQEKFKNDVQKEGEEALEELILKGGMGIVLAGRPYHLDPEINHGIPEMINDLGVAVFTEDSVCQFGSIERPLRIIDQWVYHNRLYRAAAFVSLMPNLELLQLTSFGCGLDAVTADQVDEIMKAKDRMYTLVKIDEGANLGAVRIRLRSLIAAVKERQRLNNKHPMIKSAAYKRQVFTKEMKKKHTIIGPQMSPIHFRLLQKAIEYCGYNFVVLDAVDPKAVEAGLKYVNNDACYPSILVAGQMIAALESGKFDINKTSLIITQTGGGCRATNYIGFIRRALNDAGWGQVPVLSLSAQGFEKNPGFKITPALLHRLVMALMIGDLLMRVLYRTRPYEKVRGSANALYEKWNKRAEEQLKSLSIVGYNKVMKGIVRDFDSLPLRPIKKARVGVVGEILVKFHPTANNNIVDTIEKEGAECVMPDLSDFFFYTFSTGIFRHKELAFPKKTEINARLFVWFLELYRTKMKKYLYNSKRFIPPSSIYDLMKGVDDIVQLGNITGEGWFLTAEMVELIKSGVPSIACVQPFACLPNHVTGKGMIKELRRRFPKSNISPIDYDPGCSEVNQLNRLKLLLSNATIGRHPDENAEGFIVTASGERIKPAVRYPEGSMITLDTEPVSEKDIPLA